MMFCSRTAWIITDYESTAEKMGLEKCHFAWMDKEQLKQAVRILEEECNAQNVRKI